MKEQVIYCSALVAVFLLASSLSAAEAASPTEHSQTVQVAASKVATSVEVLLSPAGTPSTAAVESKPCSASNEVALFGINGRYEDYLRLCFPCCFCCGPSGNCCDECKKNNKLTAAQPQSRNE